MIDRNLAQKRIRESLVGFPPNVIDSYSAFATSGDLSSLDIVVRGVLYFYLAKKPQDSIEALPGSTRLVEDLGCDSLTMMDTVFMVESLLDVKIDDAELVEIRTLDDLRSHLRQKFQGGTPAVR